MKIDAKNPNEICYRCGVTVAIEKHHIKQRRDGGGDEPENKQSLCTHCHDYEHAKHAILESIEKENLRLEVLKKRLNKLEELNSIENIRLFGERSYYTEGLTEPLPNTGKCKWRV